MPEENLQKRGRGRPPKPKESSVDKTHEFSSYSSQREYSNYYFGFNIFDYYSQEQLASMVRNPMDNISTLRDLSRMLYGSNGVYSSTIDFTTAMPTLARVVVAHGNDASAKKRNKELMLSTLRTIKDAEITRDDIRRNMIDGMAFYYFETSAGKFSKDKRMSDFDVRSIVELNELGINASIISLPTDYMEIVGIKNNTYVAAFDLNYFSNLTEKDLENKLRAFPKEIRDEYNKRKQDGSLSGENWVVLDNTKTIVTKIRSDRSEKYGRPAVLAAVSDILYQDYFNTTKRNVLDEINNKVIYQVFPEGQTKGTCALTKNQQEKQHEDVKGAILHRKNRGATSFISVAAGTKLQSLDTSNLDIFDDKYESNLGNDISSSLGIDSSLIGGRSDSSYASQSNNLALITARLFQWIEQFSSELNKCISANIINDDKNWVEFKYLPITHLNKKEMVGYAQDLYLQGSGSISLWAAACGIEPDVFFSLLDEEIENGVYEKYKPHQTSYTLSDKKPGRTETDDPSANTQRTKNNNGNGTPSPSDI